jgi:2,5-diketo-D-gluconate reductase B
MITLRSGHSIPQLGLGTWELTGPTCTVSVEHAIEMGYRHIDTAFGYRNHSDVAAGIRQSGISRDELFVTTKIPLNQLTRQAVLDHGARLQDELGMEYVDLLLIHWPDRNVEFEETFGAMDELVKSGVARSIGISNFNAELVAEADAASRSPIVTNQVEFHPFLNQKSLQQVCEDRGITITAYSPLARGNVVADPRLQEIGRQYDVGPAQVAVAWLLSKGFIVIPKASSETHLRSNLSATTLEISNDHIAEIDSFGDHRRFVDWPGKHYPLE